MRMWLFAVSRGFLCPVVDGGLSLVLMRISGVVFAAVCTGLSAPMIRAGNVRIFTEMHLWHKGVGRRRECAINKKPREGAPPKELRNRQGCPKSLKKLQ